MPIRKSVGLAGKSLGNKDSVANGVEDVRIIQRLLNEALGKLASKKFPPFAAAVAIPESGQCDNQTVAAIVAFQRYAMRDPRPSGVVSPGDATLRLLYAVANDFKFSGLPSERTDTITNPLHKPQAPSAPYDLAPDIEMNATIEKAASRLAKEYLSRTGKKFKITSGVRNARRQAAAMYDKYRSGDKLVGLYGSKAEPIARVCAQAKNREAAIKEIEQIILDFSKRGILMSRHMPGKAFDVSKDKMSAANRAAFLEAVKAAGGLSVINEGKPPHFHVDIEDE